MPSKNPEKCMGRYSRDRAEEASAPTVNHSAKAALGINSIGDIYGKLVARKIAETQKIVKVNSVFFFSRRITDTHALLEGREGLPHPGNMWSSVPTKGHI